MINRRAFDWESFSLTLTAGAVPMELLNVKSLDWSDTYGVTPTFGIGGLARGFGNRNYRAQGSLELADESYGALLKAAAAFGGFYKLIFNINASYGDNPYSFGYSEKHELSLFQCKPQRRGGASRQGASEARIIRIEFEILGGVTDLDLSELKKIP